MQLNIMPHFDDVCSYLLPPAFKLTVSLVSSLCPGVQEEGDHGQDPTLTL